MVGSYIKVKVTFVQHPVSHRSPYDASKKPISNAHFLADDPSGSFKCASSMDIPWLVVLQRPFFYNEFFFQSLWTAIQKLLAITTCCGSEFQKLIMHCFHFNCLAYCEARGHISTDLCLIHWPGGEFLFSLPHKPIVLFLTLTWSRLGVRAASDCSCQSTAIQRCLILIKRISLGASLQ